MGQGPGAGIDVLLQLSAGDRAVVFLVIALGLALKALILWWLYEDTTSRGHRPLPWLVAAAILDIPTLVVWLFVRPPHPGDPGPARAAGTRRPVPDQPLPLGNDADYETADDPYEAPYRPSPARPLAPTVEEPATAEGEEEIPLICPQCGTRFHVRRSDGPRRVSCPGCGQSGTLPGRTRPSG